MSFGLWTLLLALGLRGQANTPNPPASGVEVLSAAEKGQLEHEPALDGRVRIYESANLRLEKQVESDFKQDGFDKIPPQLEAWTELLETSRKDIEAHANRKKKSRAVIRYEIQLRKTIADVRSLALMAPAEYGRPFEEWLASAERVRKSLVDVLFQR
ncbi:MAG: hypothetical protein DMG07_05915 [Acidobacteria bacterium]|nr:MAG: hypothetical protein DMG07_05915 [Acidobacteriota bacterium]